jgi:copper chaperone NosL
VTRLRGLALGLVAVVLGVALLRLAAHWAGALPEGPEPVAWDRTACARCRMLVSEPSFAAQLQQLDGAVFEFDDPGCLLLHLHEQRPAVHAVYLHHREEERWLEREQVAFIPAGPSPMGYDLGAVERERPGALSWARALELSRAREAGRLGGPP